MLKKALALGLFASVSAVDADPASQAGASDSAESADAIAQAPWQTDYGKFVEAYRACSKDASCNVHAMLAGKVVTWEGTVTRTAFGGNRVVLEMWPDKPSVVGRASITRTLICCIPNLKSLEGWIDLRPGQIVRFSATLQAGEALPPVSLYGGPGEAPVDPPPWVTPVDGPVAIVQLSQARLLTSR